MKAKMLFKAEFKAIEDEESNEFMFRLLVVVWAERCPPNRHSLPFYTLKVLKIATDQSEINAEKAYFRFLRASDLDGNALNVTGNLNHLIGQIKLRGLNECGVIENHVIMAKYCNITKCFISEIQN